MIAVIFEVVPTDCGKSEYLQRGAGLKERLSDIPGFISIERFQSLNNPEKLLSLSIWETEEAVEKWRNLEEHRIAQAKGRSNLFEEYRIRVAMIIREYTLTDREGAPQDSREYHG
jgi:heme-degrading monooxygenase HmoA